MKENELLEMILEESLKTNEQKEKETLKKIMERIKNEEALKSLKKAKGNKNIKKTKKK